MSRSTPQKVLELVQQVRDRPTLLSGRFGRHSVAGFVSGLDAVFHWQLCAGLHPWIHESQGQEVSPLAWTDAVGDMVVPDFFERRQALTAEEDRAIAVEMLRLFEVFVVDMDRNWTVSPRS